MLYLVILLGLLCPQDTVFKEAAIDEVVVKAEYSKRLLKSIYNDEPSVSISVAYEGFFL